jgi:hypothetical protein
MVLDEPFGRAELAAHRANLVIEKLNLSIGSLDLVLRCVGALRA